MKIFTTAVLLVVLTVLILALFAPGACAGVAYREIFPIKSGENNYTFSTCGWMLHYGDTAIAYPTDNTGPDANDYWACVAAAPGCPTDLEPVNSNADMGSTQAERDYALINGYVFWTHGTSLPQYFDRHIVWTSEMASLTIPVENLSEISWYEANSVESSLDQLAVKVGGSWYVYSQGFSYAVPMAYAGRMSVTNFTGAVWYPMTFTPGGPSGGGAMSVDKTQLVTLGSGNIEAAGIYFDAIQGGMANRIDNFEIQASGTVKGTITLQNFALGTRPVAVDINIKSASVDRTETTILRSNGNYSLRGLEPDTYELTFKAAQFLTKKVTGVGMTGGALVTRDVTLLNGDVDGDDQVTSSDLSSVLVNIDAHGDM